MSPRGTKKPHAAFCEEYDEDTHAILPETRQVANIAAKRSTTDLRGGEIVIDIGSDSGYSSRTAATINSGQSPPSGRRSPVALKVDTTAARGFEMERLRDIRREKGRKDGRETSSRRPTLESIQDDGMRNARMPAAASPKSPVKTRRRESASIRHHPGSCWECEQGLYHPSPSVEPNPMDMSYFYQNLSPAVQTVPASPTSIHYPTPFAPEVNVAANPHLQRRMSRSGSYHANARPLSFHGMTPEMYAGAMSMSPFDSGPPMSASAYSNMLPYHNPNPFAEQSQYYDEPEPAPQPVYERPRTSSKSRPKERSRRLSSHGPPIISQPSRPAPYDEGIDMERKASREHRERREHRARAPSHSRDADEDYYLMPPPPPPLPKQKSQHAQVIQKRPELSRKSATVPEINVRRRSSNAFDLADLEAALPDRTVKRMSRDPLLPERSQSMRNARRTTSYHESSRPTRVSVEASRRRRTSYYEDPEPAPPPPPPVQRSRTKDTKLDMDQKQRRAEEYQAARSGKAVPLTADALFKAKASQRPDSESSSSKSHASSSRNSDSHSRDGSLAGSKADDNNSITMTMNGVIMSFPHQTAISFRPGEEGSVELNIGGPRPKKYLVARSDHTTSSGRREIEDLRSSRDDRRSDRASRRSSRSNYSGR